MGPLVTPLPQRSRPLAPSPVLGRDGSLPQGDAKHDAVEGMFDRLAPRYDRMNRLISLGMDKGWRRRTVDALAAVAGGTVLDLTCGFALRNFVDLDAVFAECARALRVGGRFAALDATVPTNALMRAGNAVW